MMIQGGLVGPSQLPVACGAALTTLDGGGGGGSCPLPVGFHGGLFLGDGGCSGVAAGRPPSAFNPDGIWGLDVLNTAGVVLEDVHPDSPASQNSCAPRSEGAPRSASNAACCRLTSLQLSSTADDHDGGGKQDRDRCAGTAAMADAP